MAGQSSSLSIVGGIGSGSLSIPRTLVSNDPIAIRKAFDDFGSMIVKPARTGHVVHSGDEYSIFTSRVLREHLDHLESARYSPAIYQELVPKKHDLRVTIVGHQVFAAAIDSQSDQRQPSTGGTRKTRTYRIAAFCCPIRCRVCCVNS